MGGRELQGFYVMLQLPGRSVHSCFDWNWMLRFIIMFIHTQTNSYFFFLAPYFKMCCLRSWITFFISRFPWLRDVWVCGGGTAWKLWI